MRWEEIFNGWQVSRSSLVIFWGDYVEDILPQEQHTKQNTTRLLFTQLRNKVFQQEQPLCTLVLCSELWFC